MRRLVGSIVALGLGLTVVAISSAAPASAAPVAGFIDTAVPGFNNPSNPTTVATLPDGRIVVAEQTGKLRVGGPSGPFPTALTVSNLCVGSERGLLGVAHSPAFINDGLVFLYYTRNASGAAGGCVNRVSRFVMNGSTIDPASEVVLLDNIASIAGNHNGGNLEFGSDGFLYVSIGDSGSDPRQRSGTNIAAQDLSLLNGKILRITLDGQPAPGNPFLAATNAAPCATLGVSAPVTTVCQEIFAYGLRNPFRFAFDRNDGSDRFFINDVGQSTLEEIDLGAIGANYGWPTREGECARGLTPPCPPPASNLGFTQPITNYGRALGQVITGGAFIPNGLWPTSYDGAYFFGDAGSGRIWVRFGNGSIDYNAPFATSVGGISDMSFGFDADGRLVLYYVQTGGGLRKITPTTPPATDARANLRMIPVTPFRPYDTGPGNPAVGVAAGKVFSGTTRRIDLDPPGAYEAALVNVTFDSNQSAGFVRLWGTQSLRPVTSSLNADAGATIAANAAIVPLDADGRFMLEATMTTRVVVDVMAWLDDTSGPVDAGRFVALPPERLVDTRIAAGTTLESGSDNPYSRPGGRIEFDADGRLGVPSDGTAGAVVISLAAIAGAAPAGYVGAFPTGSTWSNTSNVNVVGADVRANMVVVPLGTGGHVSLETLNVPDVVVDVVGYVTSASAPASTSGRYSSIDAVRIVDTRVPVGFGRFGEGNVQSVTVPGSSPASAVVQNITVAQTSAAGWVATFPESGAPPLVSTLNYSAPNQIRAALAFTPIPASRVVSYKSLVPTDLVIDVIGTFST